MSELLLFGSTFGMVFFLGFQSLSVNSGHYWIAALNSLIIGTFNLVLYKTAPHVSAPWEIVAYITGGPLGITAAMYMHRNHIGPWMTALKSERDQVDRFRAIVKIAEDSGAKCG